MLLDNTRWIISLVHAKMREQEAFVSYHPSGRMGTRQGGLCFLVLPSKAFGELIGTLNGLASLAAPGPLRKLLTYQKISPQALNF